jgi:hypothetical protein
VVIGRAEIIQGGPTLPTQKDSLIHPEEPEVLGIELLDPKGGSQLEGLEDRARSCHTSQSQTKTLKGNRGALEVLAPESQEQNVNVPSQKNIALQV